MDGILIVMSGFSGAGKGTLLHRLLNDYDDFAFSVSMTTRSPREGEVDGKDYFFVTKEVFKISKRRYASPPSGETRSSSKI